MKRLPLIIPFSFIACSDYEISQLCTDDEPAFDIEKVSTLEDAEAAVSGWFSADGVHLQIPDYGSIPEGALWRIVSVDVLWMVPANEYDGTSGFPSSWDSAELAVEVVDSANPNDMEAKRWVVEQQVTPGSMDWETVELEGGTGQASESDYYSAWWNFSFAVETSTDFLTGSDYFVGLVWPDYGEPEVGYSYFNRPCEKNWQINDGDDAWTQNSTTSSEPNSCSWPMLRVNTEVSWESLDGC